MIPLGILASSIRTSVIGLRAPDITVRYAAAGDWTITLQLAGGSEFAEGLRVYRSTEPLDLDALPEPVAELDADAEQWVDADVEPGQTYYYAVGAYVGGAVAMSAVVEREAVWTPLDISAAVILDDDSAISQESGKVSSIVNRGVLGGSFSQSTDAYRPTIIGEAANGKRALAFRVDENVGTGLSGDAAVRNLYRNAAVGWMFAVVRRVTADTSATSRRVFASYTPSNTARLGIYWDDGTAGAQNRIVAGGGDDLIAIAMHALQALRAHLGGGKSWGRMQSGVAGSWLCGLTALRWLALRQHGLRGVAQATRQVGSFSCAADLWATALPLLLAPVQLVMLTGSG